jgi:hypothetical protein
MQQQMMLFANKGQENFILSENDPYIGKRFNKLLVLKKAYKNQWGKWVYQCKCDCGEKTFQTISRIKLGYTKSCGCGAKEYRKNNHRLGEFKKIDILGKKYGSLTVIKEGGRNSKGEIQWVCKCECGKEMIKNGMFLRHGTTMLHCGCKNIPKIKPIITKRKPIDLESFAQDIYCSILAGESLEQISKNNGCKSATHYNNLLLKYIPTYKKASIERREKSQWRDDEQRKHWWSKKFPKEKDLQLYCEEKLKNRGIVFTVRDKSLTGFEIDIATKINCYELKNVTRKKALYVALGQLISNSETSNLKPVLIIPSDCKVHPDVKTLFKDKGIDIIDEEKL